MTFIEAVAMIRPKSPETCEHLRPVYSAVFLDDNGTGWRCASCGKELEAPK